MSNNLTQIKGEERNREEQQIQTINIENRKDRRTTIVIIIIILLIHLK